MLQSFKVKNHATFDPIGVEVNNLKKVNFFYGANGTGKTTMTNFLTHPDSVEFGDCEISWRGNQPLKILTYNKKFRKDNFDSGKIDGVFTLGNATKEDLEHIEQMKSERDVIIKNGSNKNDTVKKQEEAKTKLDNEFTDYCWSHIYKKYEADFKEAFKGFIGSKVKFKDKIIGEFKTSKKDLLDLDTLKIKAKTLFGEIPPPLNEIINVDSKLIIEIENNGIWEKRVIGKSDVDIAKLIQRLNINDWVNEGKDYIEEGSDICPFCQKNTVDAKFRKQLEEYFDESFVADTKLIEELSKKYIDHCDLILVGLQLIESNESLNKRSKLNINSFSTYLKALAERLQSNKELLNSKSKEPSRIINLLSSEEFISEIKKIIQECNKQIKEYNNVIYNFASERAKLIAGVWSYIINENKIDIEKYIKNSTGLQKGIDSLNNETQKLRGEYTKLDNKIKEANKNVTSVQPSVDAINDTLLAYGFDNFKIVPYTEEKNKYQIQRNDGTLVKETLSEGEITFITFLYFLERAKGDIKEESVMDDRVLVIDDPISSLDGTILFVVSSLIKEQIKRVKENTSIIKQILIFTHNVYFFKEVSYVDRSYKNSGYLHYWIIRKKNNVSSIKCYEDRNPIKGSYELLWHELKNREGLSDVTTQNTMRKILEIYFKTMGGYKDEDLINSFESVGEKEICRSLLCWANEGSHCIIDDFFVEHPEQMTDKYFDVFQNIFKNMEHSSHYEMMMASDKQKPIEELVASETAVN
jgi:wobble nucleotide-excising tRNase